MTVYPSAVGELRRNRRQAPGLPSQPQYLLIIGSVLVLALTGLPQRLDFFGPSEWLMDAAGGIETLRAIHHGAGAVLIVAGLYHISSAIFASLANPRHGLLSMIPDGRDYLDAFTMSLYFLGLRRNRPTLREPSYFQKLDYWVLAWGLTVMALTGFVRLFPARTTNLLSGDVVAAALQAHSDFALLIVAWVAVIHVAYATLLPQPEAGIVGSEG